MLGSRDGGFGGAVGIGAVPTVARPGTAGKNRDRSANRLWRPGRKLVQDLHVPMVGDKTRGALFGLAAAALFGASAPVSKRLLPAMSPLMLAGLLYLGAGLSLLIYRTISRTGARLWHGHHHPPGAVEASVSRRDLLPLAVIAIVGGILSPLAMLTGLQRVSGVSGSLLLNLEAPFTMLIAGLLFREHLGRRLGLAAALIVGGAILLGRPWAGAVAGDALGALLIALACLGWGLDNNLSQRVSLKDPQQVVLIKTLGAGTASLILAVMLGHRWPAVSVLLPALALGAASYGASLLLDMYALRLLGAAREAAFFATAPFIGALLALPVLGEAPGLAELGAGALMIGGVFLLLRERHSHQHTHDPVEHEHLHTHDEHHQHSHEGLPAPITEPHAHLHKHDPITHDHPHVPDLHHRHRH
jgi:drug/metabolite transporter (DMT)-like permease